MEWTPTAPWTTSASTGMRWGATKKQATHRLGFRLPVFVHILVHRTGKGWWKHQKLTYKHVICKIRYASGIFLMSDRVNAHNREENTWWMSCDFVNTELTWQLSMLTACCANLAEVNGNFASCAKFLQSFLHASTCKVVGSHGNHLFGLRFVTSVSSTFSYSLVTVCYLYCCLPTKRV